MKLTEKRIERITKEANKAIHKKFPLLHNSVENFQVPYVIRAYLEALQGK